MWKVIVNSRQSFVRRRILDPCGQHIFFKRRGFLSEAFRCQDMWDKRLQAPIFPNIKLGELYQELDSKFQNDGKASAIDIDLFANVVQDESYMDELDDLLHRLRLCPNTADTLPTTTHAFIRTCLAFHKHDDLLRVLDDRLNYGMFADDYCCALLMDTFLKQNNYTAAAKVAAMQMLQEDWSHPLTAHLALYSCHMYLRSPGPGPWEQPQQPDDGEEVKVRVQYLRNPYFDDHFDLRDPKLLVGKTLASLGATFPDAVGQTYELVGWGLYQKWDRVIHNLEMQVKPPLFYQGVELLRDALKDAPEEERGKISQLLDYASQVTDKDLHDAVVTKVKSAVAETEKEVIEKQRHRYVEWEKQRDRLLWQQLQELTRLRRLEKVELEKDELAKREEVLFYFDNEEKWELQVEKKQQEIAAAQPPVHKHKSKSSDEGYIPPEVGVSRN